MSKKKYTNHNICKFQLSWTCYDKKSYDNYFSKEAS